MPESVLLARVEELEKELANTKRQLELITSLATIAVEPGDIEHLIRRSLESIARANQWPLAQFWKVVSEEEVIVCTDYYYGSAVFKEFREASADRRFSKGVGLPGRIWANTFPVLIPMIEREAGLSFPRKVSATKCGITSAYGFCIKSGPLVRGIFEFFSFEQIKLTDADHLFYEKLGEHIAILFAEREADLAARTQETIHRIVLNNSYNGFIAIDESSLITDWTGRTRAILGWEREEVMGKPLHEVVIPQRFRDAHIKGIFRYLTTKQGPVLKKRIQTMALSKDGSEVPIELFIFPIETNDVKGFGAFIRDLRQNLGEPDVKLE